METAANLLKVSVIPVEVGPPEADISARLDTGSSQPYASLMVLPDDPFLTHLRRRLVAVAGRHRMPLFFGINEAVEDGGLMGYGQPLYDAHHRAADDVDRIAEGAEAGGSSSPATDQIPAHSESENGEHTGASRFHVPRHFVLTG